MEAKEFKKPEVKKDLKHDYQYLRAKDREKVRGIFKFYEVPGGSMSFNFRKWKGDPLERYDMIDGQVYTVPLGVARHLNNDCWYPIHAYTKDEHGNTVQGIGKKVKRCGFQSLEFVDIEGLENNDNLLQAV